MSDDPRGTRPAPRRLLFREALGREAHDERVRRGERLVDVARTAALSPQYLSEIERGRKDPSSEVLRELAHALGLDPLELVGRAATRMADARAVDRERVLVAAGPHTHRRTLLVLAHDRTPRGVLDLGTTTAPIPARRPPRAGPPGLLAHGTGAGVLVAIAA